MRFVSAHLFSLVLISNVYITHIEKMKLSEMEENRKRNHNWPICYTFFSLQCLHDGKMHVEEVAEVAEEKKNSLKGRA